MNYEQCIRLTMRGLEKFLESHTKYTSSKNFNISHIELADDGFKLIEETRFQTEYSYGVPSIQVSPYFIIKMLFDGLDGKSDEINSWVKKISEREYTSSISYLEVIKMIDNMRDTYNQGIESNSIDIQYFKFKKMLSSVSKDDYASLKNQILSLKNLDYASITNISNEHRTLARKMERMYQLELMLRQFCIKHLIQEGEIKLSPEEWNDYLTTSDLSDAILGEVDLKSQKTNWTDFCSTIREGLKEDKDKINVEFKNEYGENNPKLTVLGLDAIYLPTSPKVLSRR